MNKLIDERQEVELLKIEHIGFWFMYYALLSLILVQEMFFLVPLEDMIPEYILFGIGTVTVSIGSARKGIWTRRSKPDMKNYLLSSFSAALLAGFLLMAFLAAQGSDYVLMIGAFVATFGVTFILVWLLGIYTKLKQAELEKRFDED